MKFVVSNKIWVAKSAFRAGDKDGTALAYMSQVDYNKDGITESAAFKKKQVTGRNWAGKDCTEEFLDNVPLAGHTLGDSVERWITEAAFFRVTDPRGFVVEVPCGNISTLLSLCTVVKGVVQEKCVWVRAGSVHVLLPEGSQPYADAVAQQNRRENVKSSSALTPGDRVRLLSHGTEEKTPLLYLGQVKLDWQAKATLGQYSYSGYRGWSRERVRIKEIKEESQRDAKWVSVFASESMTVVYPKEGEPLFNAEYHRNGQPYYPKEISDQFPRVREWQIRFELSPKVLEVVGHEELPPALVNPSFEDLRQNWSERRDNIVAESLYTFECCPDRVKKSFKELDYKEMEESRRRRDTLMWEVDYRIVGAIWR
ncbi:hypothetical protein QE320_gp097 [Pseudomonas phage EM]|uniref:Uncharacterized protein n=1 Tax=Pseudomonas phage EM TaxID=2936914 RepID=A0AAE9KST9_9CAUD|nr:hypothetical protein QE320_gp097 [Pseudomonas phage EM]UPW35957.1 hypothetical protein EM_172 [Pseudomonas phage EM]